MADAAFLIGDQGKKNAVLFSEKLHKAALKVIMARAQNNNSDKVKLIPFFESVVADSLCNIASKFLAGQNQIEGLNFDVAEYNIWALLYGDSNDRHNSFEGSGLDSSHQRHLNALKKSDQELRKIQGGEIKPVPDRRAQQAFLDPSCGFYAIASNIPFKTLKSESWDKGLAGSAYPKKLEILVSKITDPKELMKGITSVRAFIDAHTAELTKAKAFSFVLHMMLYNWNDLYYELQAKSTKELTGHKVKPQVNGGIVTEVAGSLGQGKLTAEVVTTLTDYFCSLKPKKDKAKLKEVLTTLFSRHSSVSAGLAKDLATSDKYENRLLDLVLYGYSQKLIDEKFGTRDQLVAKVAELAPEQLRLDAYVKETGFIIQNIKLTPSKANPTGAKARYEFNDLQMFYLENQTFMNYVGLRGAPSASERCYDPDAAKALANLKGYLSQVDGEKDQSEKQQYIRLLLKYHVNFSTNDWIQAFKDAKLHLYIESEHNTFLTILDSEILPLSSAFKLADYAFKVAKRVSYSDRKDDPETKRLRALLELSLKGVAHFSDVLKHIPTESRDRYFSKRNQGRARGTNGSLNTNLIVQLLIHFALFRDQQYVKTVLSQSFYKLPDEIEHDPLNKAAHLLLFDNAADLLASISSPQEAELRYAELVAWKVLNLTVSQQNENLLTGALALIVDSNSGFSAHAKLSRLQQNDTAQALASVHVKFNSVHSEGSQKKLLNSIHNLARLIKKLGGSSGAKNSQDFLEAAYTSALSRDGRSVKSQKQHILWRTFLQVLQSDFGNIDTPEESTFKFNIMQKTCSRDLLTLIKFIVQGYKAEDDSARDFCHFLYQRVAGVIDSALEDGVAILPGFDMPIEPKDLLSFVRGKDKLLPEDYMKLALIAKGNALESFVHISQLDDSTKLQKLVDHISSKSAHRRSRETLRVCFDRIDQQLHHELFVVMKMKGVNRLRFSSIVRAYSLTDHYLKTLSATDLLHLAGRLGLDDFRRVHETYGRLHPQQAAHADKIFLFWAVWNNDLAKIKAATAVMGSVARVTEALDVGGVEHLEDAEYNLTQRDLVLAVAQGKPAACRSVEVFDTKPKPDTDEHLQQLCDSELEQLTVAVQSQERKELAKHIQAFAKRPDKFRAIPFNCADAAVVDAYLSFHSEMHGDPLSVRKLWPHLKNPRSLVESAVRLLRSCDRVEKQLFIEEEAEDVPTIDVVPRNRIAAYALMLAAAAGDDGQVDAVLGQITNETDKIQVGAKLLHLFSDPVNKKHQDEFFKAPTTKKILAKAAELVKQNQGLLDTKAADQLTAELNFRQKADLILQMHEQSPEKIAKTASDPSWITSHKFVIPKPTTNKKDPKITTTFEFSNKVVSECFSQKDGHIVFYRVCKAVLKLETELENMNSNLGKEFVAEVQKAYNTPNSTFKVFNKGENSTAVPAIEIDPKAAKILASFRFSYKGKNCTVNALSKPHQSYFELKAIHFNLKQMNSDFESTYGEETMGKIIQMQESPLQTKEIMMTIPYSKRKLFEGTFGVNPNDQTFLTARAVVEYKRQKQLQGLFDTLNNDISPLVEQKDLWALWASQLGAKNAKEWHENIYKSLPANMAQPEPAKPKQ